MRSLIVVMVGVVLAGCNGGSTNCVPGQSVACVGVAGCSGGQVCLADGSAYGECACGSVSNPDAGSGTDGSPTQGALVAKWSVTYRPGMTGCVFLASGTEVRVVMTPSSTGNAVIERRFACEASTGTITDVPFDTYFISMQTVNPQGQSTGSATGINVPFDSTGCITRPEGDCGREVTTNIQID